MYFADFESFERARSSAKSFVLYVEVIDGTSITSSAFPINSYAQVMADIAVVEELKTMLTLWDRDGGDGGAIKFIPYEQIRTISVLFRSSK